MPERTRTIHSRLPDEILLGCYDAAELVLKIDPRRESTSTVVRLVLTSFINALQKKGSIAKYENQAQIKRMLDEFMGVEQSRTKSQILEEIDPSLEDYEEAPDTESEETEVRNLLGQALDKLESEQFQNNMAVDDDIDDTPIAQPTLDLSKMERTPFTELSKQAPKDILIAKAIETKDPQLTKAIEFVYHGLPITQWGTDGAIEAVEFLLEQMEQLTNEPEL